MPTERIQSLVDKYFADGCSPAEKEELAAWIDQEEDDRLKEMLAAAWERHVPLVSMPEEMSVRIVNGMFGEVGEVVGMEALKGSERGKQSGKLLYWPWMAAAAVVLLMVAGIWYFQPARPVAQQPAVTQVAALPYKGDVAPGHSGAILHLSNGQEVVLDSAGNGTIAVQGGMQAVKTGGMLRYTGHNEAIIYNDVTTGPGRQWQLTLSDGTRVWLNAASSIHYPLAFKGSVREVSVTGEAYFEVAHHAEQTFRVKVGDQVIEDIGTAFNINAYNDEPMVKTTLAEGAIRVSTSAVSVLVKPGEQVSEKNGRLNVGEGNVEQATAWRRGVFSCRHANIPEMMRQLARWYNVSVEFRGSISPDITFTGDISRSLSLAQVLHGLRGMNVHFTIEEDKKIVILP